jgi:hypothetical protein
MVRVAGCSVVAILASLLTAGTAMSADCPQEHALYADADGAYEMAFQAVDPESSASSHSFKMRVKNTDLVLDGYVMGSEPVNRSNGMIFHNCPEGDVTGADLAACTVWEGVIYSNDNGKIDLLPQQGKKAAQQLLLPGFGPSLRASSAWGAKKATIVPWDVLTLKGCSP